MSRQFVKIRFQDIPEYLNNDTFWQYEHLPISRQRLFAQSHNPDADSEDVVLIVALDGHQVVGYIGAVPGYIYCNGAKQKIGWGSTWWSAPNQLGTGGELLLAMYNEWNGKYGISAYADSVHQLYKGSKLFSFYPEMRGFKAWLRFDAEALVPHHSIKRKIATLACCLLQPIQDFRLKKRKKHLLQKLNGYTVSYRNYVDQSLEKFLQGFHNNHLQQRDAIYFNNLKAYRWVETHADSSLAKESTAYCFSSVALKFAHSLVQIQNKQNNTIGFVVLLNHNNTVEVLYVYAQPEHFTTITEVIVLHAIASKATNIRSFEHHINQHLQNYKGTWFSKRTINRNFILSKKLGMKDPSKHQLHSGDGDYAYS